MTTRKLSALLLVLVLALTAFSGCTNAEYEKTSYADAPVTQTQENLASQIKTVYDEGFSLNDVPDFSGMAYCIMNNNTPYFCTGNFSPSLIYEQFGIECESGSFASFEYYNDLDEFERVTWAFACVGRDLMPTEERQDISSVHPTGWVGNEYRIKNRCHLIGFQLSGENDNEKNLFTGTRYLNVEGMLPFENRIAEYVEDFNGHIFYRVTPVFEGENSLASGVLLEAFSCEDNGESVKFCVYCYNIQEGYRLDYKTGRETELSENETSLTQNETGKEYIVNTNTNKFHAPDCVYAQNISEKNKTEYRGDAETLLSQGYSACRSCCSDIT